MAPAQLAQAAGFVIGLKMGLAGAWIAMGLDWAVRSTLLAMRFRSGRWKTLKVQAKGLGLDVGRVGWDRGPGRGAGGRRTARPR
ncbi:MAG: hypothetical protein Q8P31_02790, partial [Bacillota bacterium]|nr:hypothetical protein [Bacillota bacterium]